MATIDRCATGCEGSDLILVVEASGIKLKTEFSKLIWSKCPLIRESDNNTDSVAGNELKRNWEFQYDAELYTFITKTQRTHNLGFDLQDGFTVEHIAEANFHIGLEQDIWDHLQ